MYPYYQSGATPLYIASQKGHENIVKVLLSGNADVNAADEVCFDC